MILVNNLPADSALSIPHVPAMVALAPMLKEKGIIFLLKLKLGDEEFILDGFGDDWEMALTSPEKLYVRLRMETMDELVANSTGDISLLGTNIHENFSLLVQIRGHVGKSMSEYYERTCSQVISALLEGFYEIEGLERVSKAVHRTLSYHCMAAKGFDKGILPTVANEVAKSVIEDASEFKLGLARNLHGFCQFALTKRTMHTKIVNTLFPWVDGVYTDAYINPGSYIFHDIDIASLKALPFQYGTVN